MKIKVNMIHQWADEHSSQGDLPLLIRKLVNASVDNLNVCDFPAVDQINSKGFDGIVESREKTRFVPEGRSVWEMGVSNRIKSKIDYDYNERTLNPLGETQSETTYVQITPRKYSRKKINEWTSERNETGPWKEVRLYSAQDLENWIELCPSVERWFAEKLGFPVDSVQSLEKWWGNWKKMGDLNITSDLVLVDKDLEKNILLDSFDNKKQIIVKSSNFNESIAFLYASLDLSSLKLNKFISRALVVHDVESMEFYSQFDNLILIPTFKDYEFNTNENNFIYIPEDNLMSHQPPDIELKDSFRPHFAEALEKIGVPDFIAKKYARDCGSNLTILKRILNPISNSAKWMEDKNIQMLKYLFFIQSCDESNRYDKKVVEELSNLRYESFLQNILLLSYQIETPILKNNEFWHLKSPKEVFFFMGKHITPYDLNRFRKIILKIFKKVPSGSIKDRKFNKCSNELKRGILKSLILISVYGENIGIEYINPQEWVDNLILELFINENENFFKYNSLFLKFISEASPDSFLKTINKDLKNENPVIYSLFPIESNGSEYLHLLYALEVLSWDKYKFQEITDILLDLSELECDYYYHNRPINTLKELFLSWHVNTFATPAAKLNSLKEILNKNLNIGWDILIFLLSHESSVSMGVTEPLFRDFPDEYYSISNRERHDYENCLRDYLLEYVGFDSDKWSFILTYSVVCNNWEFQNKLIDKLRNAVVEIDDKKHLWNHIRDIIYKYEKSFGENNYSCFLKEIYDEVTPEDIIDCYDYLFNNASPFLIGFEIDNMRTGVNDKRQNAINEIIKKEGFNGIMRLVENVKYPNIVGNYVSNFSFDEEVLGVLGLNENVTKFSMSYIFDKSKSDLDWIENMVLFIESENWDTNKIVLFFISLNPSSKVHELLLNFDNDIQELYWKSTDRYFICENETDGKNHVSQLIKYSRFDDVILFMWDNFSLLGANFVGDSLCKILVKSNHDLECEESLIMEILEKLNDERYDEQKLMKLEFYFSHCFRDEQPIYPLKIHRKLAEDSDIICKLINGLFGDSSEYKCHCQDILETWNIIPGNDFDGNVDYGHLINWFNRASESLTYEGYVQLCKIMGKLFAETLENEENWPMSTICRFIDDKNVEKINYNFSMSLIMKWSCYSKSILDGGNREWDIAERYEKYAENLIDEYPVTSNLLKNVSKHFKSRAKEEEINIKDIDYRQNQ